MTSAAPVRFSYAGFHIFHSACTECCGDTSDIATPQGRQRRFPSRFFEGLVKYGQIVIGLNPTRATCSFSSTGSCHLSTLDVILFWLELGFSLPLSVCCLRVHRLEICRSSLWIPGSRGGPDWAFGTLLFVFICIYLILFGFVCRVCESLQGKVPWYSGHWHRPGSQWGMIGSPCQNFVMLSTRLPMLELNIYIYTNYTYT
jgi:hypothetical protein